MRALDEIAIEGLRVDCVVGIYPRERRGTQPLLVDVVLKVDTEEAGRAQALQGSVDYAHVAAQVAFLLENARFRMLETAAQALLRLLLLPPATTAAKERRGLVEEAAVRLCKPDALGGNGRPAVTVRRDRAWLAAQGTGEARPYGAADVLARTRDAALCRLSIAPGQALPAGSAGGGDVVDLMLGGGLLCGGKRLGRGSVHRFAAGASARYENGTGEVQSLLRVEALGGA